MHLVKDNERFMNLHAQHVEPSGYSHLVYTTDMKK